MRAEEAYQLIHGGKLLHQELPVAVEHDQLPYWIMDDLKGFYKPWLIHPSRPDEEVHVAYVKDLGKVTTFRRVDLADRLQLLDDEVFATITELSAPSGDRMSFLGFSTFNEFKKFAQRELKKSVGNLASSIGVGDTVTVEFRGRPIAEVTMRASPDGDPVPDWLTLEMLVGGEHIE